MLDLTNHLSRMHPQVRNSWYPGGLRFFAESVDSDGNAKSASKQDFMYAYVSLCNDTLHFAGVRLTSAYRSRSTRRLTLLALRLRRSSMGRSTTTSALQCHYRTPASR